MPLVPKPISADALQRFETAGLVLRSAQLVALVLILLRLYGCA